MASLRAVKANHAGSAHRPCSGFAEIQETENRVLRLFVPEPESDDLNQALAGLTDVVVSDLALTEMASALGRRVREQGLTLDSAQRLYPEDSNFRRLRITPPIHRRAERLMLSLATPLRALDALHLATALHAEAATLVTFDPRLREAADSQGMFVAPSNA